MAEVSFESTEDYADPFHRLVTIPPISNGREEVVRRGNAPPGMGEGGELALGEVLRLRVRYFTDRVVLGSRNYVNEVFAEFRNRFGARRKTGTRPLRGLAALSHLSTLRDLRVDVVR